MAGDRTSISGEHGSLCAGNNTGVKIDRDRERGGGGGGEHCECASRLIRNIFGGSCSKKFSLVRASALARMQANRFWNRDVISSVISCNEIAPN